MLTDIKADKIYLAVGYTDLRRGIDGLACIVQDQFRLDPFTNTLFLFCGRRRDRIKGLLWEDNGFILLYKRLEVRFVGLICDASLWMRKRLCPKENLQPIQQ